MESIAPDFTGIKTWFNSEPLSVRKLRGKVVLVDFWTYTCVNCIRTLPHLRKWHRKYGKKGLVIIGVHSPEFEFEKDERNVKAAIRRHGIRYPVGLDNEMKTWINFNNRFWPCHYIVDSKGKVRHIHAGEGAYAETELWLVKLLSEAGTQIKAKIEKTERPTYNVNTTLETYCGSRRGSLGNTAQSGKYAAPEKYDPGKIYLDGHWTQEKEYLENTETGQLTIVFRAKTVNLVMSPKADPLNIKISIDGKPVEKAVAGTDVNPRNSTALIDRPDMYNIYNKKEFGTHEMKITADKPSRFFAFTFG